MYYEKLLLQYYVENRYSDVPCMSMRNTEIGLEKKMGKSNWTFSLYFMAVTVTLP